VPVTQPMFSIKSNSKDLLLETKATNRVLCQTSMCICKLPLISISLLTASINYYYWWILSHPNIETCKYQNCITQIKRNRSLQTNTISKKRILLRQTRYKIIHG